MRISPNNVISAVNTVKSISPINGAKAGQGQQPKIEPKFEQKFDTVTIGADSSFRQALLGRISQEVRTATTTGTVNALREQVQAGEYKIDTESIARKMLFLGEV